MNALAVAFPTSYRAVPALQRHLPHDLPRNKSNVFQVVAPIQRPETSVGSRSMSYADNPRTIGKQICDALWCRINAGAITRKHLQHALGVSSGTVDNLLSGNNDPSARVFMGLLTMMDAAFANEILAPTGCTVAKISDARAAALRKVAEGMAELQQMEGR